MDISLNMLSAELSDGIIENSKNKANQAHEPNIGAMEMLSIKRNKEKSIKNT